MHEQKRDYYTMGYLCFSLFLFQGIARDACEPVPGSDGYVSNPHSWIQVRNKLSLIGI